MAGSSPEYTVVARSLKDLNRFIGSSASKSIHPWNEETPSPCMKLNFSDAGDETLAMNETIRDRSFTGGRVKRKASDDPGQTLKKHRDSVTGLDVCRLLRDKDAEVLHAKMEITKLNAEISSSATELNKLKLEYDSELSKLRLSHLRDKEMIAELQLKVKSERKAAELAKEECGRLRDETILLRSSSQQKLVAETTQHSLQHEQLKEELCSTQEKLAASDKKLHDRSCELALIEAENQSLKEQSSSYLQQLKQLRQDLNEVDELKLSLQKERAANKELESRLANVAEQEKLAQTFESCVQKMPELERQVDRLTRENDMLRACSANTRLLEEKVASAGDEIALLQQRCDEAAQLRAELDATKELLRAVKDVLRTELCLPSSPEPDTLRSVLRQLRSSDQSLTDAIKTMKESLTAHESRNTELEKEVKELRESSRQQQQGSERHLQLARRLQRKLLLVSKERDSLKTILTSYEAEVTMTSTTAASSGRIASLEETLAQHKQELARLEKELDYYQHAPQRPGEPAAMSSKDRAELCNLKDQVSQLKEEVSKLQEEKEILEYRLEQRAMKGDYDPSQVNVLHMKQNPTSEAVSSYEDEKAKLQQEVEQLKEQLAAAVSAASEAASKNVASSSAPQSDDAEADKLRVQELEKELKTMEVKQERYVDAFKDRSKEMRELVYRLTGYLIKPTDESNCYKLSNMYAESSDDFFMFEMASNGEINLLSTDFSNSLEDMIDAYLNHENSYPAFLSAVTIDLFNRQTMIAGGPSRGLSPANASQARAAKAGEDVDSEGEKQDEDNAMEDDEDASDEGDHDDEEPIDSDSEGEVGPRVDIPGDEDDEDDDDDEDEYNEDEDEDEGDNERQPANNAHDDGSDDDLICLD